MNIAFLGTGLMGAGFVRHLLQDGHQVTVWNRSPEKARALEAAGAKVADTAQAAIAGAASIHLSLSDDASVDAVLEPLAAAIGPETWIVDHTTTAPTPTAARAKRWAERGRHFAHAPVFMTPANCAAGTGFMLLSGPEETHAALKALLGSMTGQLVYLGGAADRAAAFKLFGNLSLLTMVGALADVNRLAHACGIATGDAYSLFSHFNPGLGFPSRAAKVVSGDTTPSFELSMARKDVRLMIEEAAVHGVTLAVVPALAALMDESIARGEGNQDVTVAALVR
jgi:3-hydroxyisobutyrate dehydrogenase